jgi:hypothetical protein
MKDRGKGRLTLDVEVLEERIAPAVIGTGGYDGQPGNQNSAHNNPSGAGGQNGWPNDGDGHHG